MAEEEKGTESGGQQASKQQFAIQRIYIKDMSFENPQGFRAKIQAKPKVNQDLNTAVTKVSDNQFEVVVKLTITVKDDEDKVIFIAEVDQAGVFFVTGIEGPALQQTLTAVCPNILFPYAREAIDSMAMRGGFQPLALPPINFDALYARAVAEAKTRAEAESKPASLSTH